MVSTIVGTAHNPPTLAMRSRGGDDPLFVNPNPAPAPGNGEEADFRLQAGSPAIDSGNNAYVPDGIETDLDGNPRILPGQEGAEPIVDRGPYEFTGGTSVPPIPGDLNGDGVVNVEDLLILLAAWGPCPDCPPIPETCLADFNGDCCRRAGPADPARELGVTEHCGDSAKPRTSRPSHKPIVRHRPERISHRRRNRATGGDCALSDTPWRLRQEAWQLL